MVKEKYLLKGNNITINQDGIIFKEGRKIGVVHDGKIYQSGRGNIGSVVGNGWVHSEDTKKYHPLGKEEEDSCFVATAVYGDGNAPPVEILREYRNKVLMNNPIGKAFVDFYYSGAGKLVANLIKEKIPGAIPLIRKGLDALVESYSSKKK